ncbi:helix-turn-helix domain-containing protein [bacterium]|nr:helix-turn-helix domain-containing protein [bacterium]
MDCATLIRIHRTRSGFSQRELAKRAATSAAAICLYETGQRVPRVDTLARILRATGATLVVDAWTDAELDASVSGDILLQVLDLSEHLPSLRPGELDAPIFAKLAR